MFMCTCVLPLNCIDIYNIYGVKYVYVQLYTKISIKYYFLPKYIRLVFCHSPWDFDFFHTMNAVRLGHLAKSLNV